MSYLSKLNLNLFKKRKLGVAVKYNYDSPTLENRFYDRLIFPKNFFDKLFIFIKFENGIIFYKYSRISFYSNHFNLLFYLVLYKKNQFVQK